MAASSCVQFPPHFHFRFGRKLLSDVDFLRKCAVRRPLVIDGLSSTVSLPVPARPEVVSSVEMAADRPIHSIGVE